MKITKMVIYNASYTFQYFLSKVDAEEESLSTPQIPWTQQSKVEDPEEI